MNTYSVLQHTETFHFTHVIIDTLLLLIEQCPMLWSPLWSEPMFNSLSSKRESDFNCLHFSVEQKGPKAWKNLLNELPSRFDEISIYAAQKYYSRR